MGRVEVGPEQGLPEVSVISCDNLLTIRRQSWIGRRSAGWMKSRVPRWIRRCGMPSTSATDTSEL
jgi:hypothetical protein